jgi:uncharacterized protein (DUF433 family)
MNWRERVEQNPKVLSGKPVIKGTRVSVELILERLGAGWSEADILQSLPTINSEDIHAACAFASRASVSA